MSGDSADPDAPVEIGHFFDVHQADFVVSVLAGSGVDAFLDQQHTGSIAPNYLFGSGGIRVLVRHRDHDRALEILNTIATSDGDAESE